MSDYRDFVESIPTDARVSPPLSGDDLLPPVEPPNAGFIIQLFVVPALIVLVIVSVWLMLGWLVHHTTMGPEKLIRGLEQGSSVARWQRASELADMLRNDRFIEFRHSEESAASLARILDREIDGGASGGGMQEGDVTLRLFLARALGEFQVNEGIETLLRAATTERDPAEQVVRQHAIQAIAVRAHNLQQLDPPQELTHPELESTLATLAEDEDPQIRLRAAYALGRLGTPASIERLEIMVDDPHANTRYNAAVALAERGNARAIETLAEMLDLEELAGVPPESNVQDLAFKRALVVTNALEGVDALARQNPSADFTPVVESLERLVAADEETLAQAQILRGVVIEARRMLKLLPPTE